MCDNSGGDHCSVRTNSNCERQIEYIRMERSKGQCHLIKLDIFPIRLLNERCISFWLELFNTENACNVCALNFLCHPHLMSVELVNQLSVSTSKVILTKVDNSNRYQYRAQVKFTSFLRKLFRLFLNWVNVNGKLNRFYVNRSIFYRCTRLTFNKNLNGYCQD